MCHCSAGGTASTGQGAMCSRRWVTLPSSRPANAVWPRVPTTITTRLLPRALLQAVPTLLLVDSGIWRGSRRPLGGRKPADGAGEPERHQHDRHDAESLLGRGCQLPRLRVDDPRNGGRRPSHPPPAAHQPKRVPGLGIQGAPCEEDDAPDAGAADAIGRVGMPRSHRWFDRRV